MKIFLILLFIQFLSFITIADESLNESKARAVMEVIAEASKNFEIETLRNYVDSESKFIWTTTIKGGKDGKEMSGDEWLEFMEFMAPLSQKSVGEIVGEIKSITIDRELNQATIIEEVKSISSVFGETYEEQAIETNILGVRDGNIKIIYSERNTTKITKVE